MHIVVSGGTGFIGQALVEELARAGHDVVVLSRKPRLPGQSSIRYVEWDARSAGSWHAEVAVADAVVNLAGEPIAEGRWTSARKRILVESRILATRLLVDALAARPRPLPVLVSASGIGYYGPSDDRLLDERSLLGEGFLAQLSAAWEAEALRAGQFGTRVVLLRTGMVLERNGGALPKMMLPFYVFAGGAGVAGHAVGVLDSSSGSHRHDSVGPPHAGSYRARECRRAGAGDDECVLRRPGEGTSSSIVASGSRSGVTADVGGVGDVDDDRSTCGTGQGPSRRL